MIIRIAGFVVIAALLASGCTRRESHPAPLDLVVVTLDTARRDHLGAYGGGDTPVLDRLARDGVLFRRAVAQAPITLPSHASILTGLLPVTHGIRDNGRFVLDARFQTLAEMLAAQGFATGAAVGAFPVAARFGLNQGFTFYDDDLTAGRGSGSSFRERPAEAVNRAALGWLETLPPGPFFLWVHYFDPHQPYDPPSPWKERFRENPYRGEIAYVDHELGELLAGLERLGRRDNTLVVVLADHGESLGEHRETTHGLFVYDSTTLIPMIVTPPASLRKQVVPGHEIGETVQTVDLVPTILELMGLPIPEGLDGKSLAPILARTGQPGSGYAYSESFYPYFGFGWSELRSIQDGTWKYIAAPRPELYDLANDPQELRNLAASRQEIAARLETALKALEARDHGAAPAPYDADTAARLRSLGYIGGPSPAGDASAPESTRVGAPPGARDPKDMVQVYLMVIGGEEFMSHGEYKRAATLLRRATDLDPRNITARLYLAQTLLEMGSPDKAFKEFRIVSEQYPEAAEAHVGMAVVHFQRGRTEEAGAELDRALAIRPSYGLAQFNRALVEEARGDPARAKEILSLAIEASPFLAPGWTKIGELNYREARWSEARDAFERALAIDPQEPGALRGLEAVTLRESEARSREPNGGGGTR